MPVRVDRTARRAGQPVSREVGSVFGPTGGGASRVLVIDPCADTVESTALLLRLWGHDVQGVRSGTKALAAARVYQPDVVLMEIRLPGLDGCEVARRLRQDGAAPGLLLVAVTGSGDERSRRRTRGAGFDCHLVKPVEPGLLERLLAARSRVGMRDRQRGGRHRATGGKAW